MSQTWRDKQAARPDPVRKAVEAWDLYDNLPAYERMVEALNAAEVAQGKANECDEPGCTREAGCGFPAEGGYRRTCYEHSKWAAL